MVMMMRFLSVMQMILNFVIYLPFIGYFINLYLSWSGSFVRWFVGSQGAANLNSCARPKTTLILYQYEGCPYCRLVRETLSVLSLDVIIYPCPRTTLARYGIADQSRYRPKATELSGKCMFPLLVDYNHTPPLVMLESRDIIKHLWEKYGQGAVEPWNYKFANMIRVSCIIPSALRCLPEMGIIRTPSKVPGKKMIELFSYDSCPYSRLIREALDTLEQPYHLFNLPCKGPHASQQLALQGIVTANRSVFGKITQVNCPVLVDPNTDTVLLECRASVQYLMNTYAIGKAYANWSEYSVTGASTAHGTIPGYARDRTKQA